METANGLVLLCTCGQPAEVREIGASEPRVGYCRTNALIVVTPCPHRPAPPERPYRLLPPE
jgi:hypothetical protein